MTPPTTHATEGVEREAERHASPFLAERSKLVDLAAVAVEEALSAHYGALTADDRRMLRYMLDSWWYRVEGDWQAQNRDRLEQEVTR